MTKIGERNRVELNLKDSLSRFFFPQSSTFHKCFVNVVCTQLLFLFNNLRVTRYAYSETIICFHENRRQEINKWLLWFSDYVRSSETGQLAVKIVRTPV